MSVPAVEIEVCLWYIAGRSYRMKKIISCIVSAMLCMVCFSAFAEEAVPTFDEPNSYVFDSENGSEPRFKYLITVSDFAREGTLKFQIYGYGGKGSHEWNDLGQVKVEGFTVEKDKKSGCRSVYPAPRLEANASKYSLYRYYAIHLVTPQDRDLQFTADMKNGNLNFYAWEADADVEYEPLPYPRNERAFSFGWGGGDVSGGTKVIVDNKSKVGNLAVTFYAYDCVNHAWVTYGSAELGKNGSSTRIKKAGKKLQMDDYPFYAISEDNTEEEFDYNVSCTKSEIRITLRDKR